MENKAENKAKFFALYYGQMVAYAKNSAGDYQLYRVLSNTTIDEVEHLSLRSISSLTDEGIKHLSRLCGIDRPYFETYQDGFWIRNQDNWQEEIKVKDNSFYHTQEAYDSGSDVIEIEYPLSLSASDYLRSIGILIPWMDLSVEDIINYGWAKEDKDVSEYDPSDDLPGVHPAI